MCVSGKCLNFDGTDDYIDAGNDPSLKLSTGGTITAWFKLDSWNGDSWSNTIIGKGGSSWVNHHYILFKQSGTHHMLFSVSDGVNYLGTNGPKTRDLELNTWYHIAVTWNNSQKCIYLNGSLEQCVDSAIMPIDSTASVSMGKTGTNGYYLDGLIDEVKIYPYARTADQIKSDYTSAGSVKGVSAQLGSSPEEGGSLSNGLVGYWKMDEGTGIYAYDISGNENIGTLTNMEEDDWTPGKFGSALEFDGTNDYIDINTSSNFDFGTGSYSVAWWMEYPITQTEAFAGIIADKNWSSAGGNTNWWGITQSGTSTNSIRYYENLTSDSSFDLSVAVDSSIPNGWHYFYLVRDTENDLLKFYRDGIQVYSNSYTLDTELINHGLRINSIAGRYTGAKMDDVRIYNYARTPSQIIQDMNAGHPIGGSPVGSQVAYWKFDEGYGTTVNNSGNQGSTLDGTLGTGTSAPSWSNSGKFNKALDFDGSTDFLSTSDSPSLDMANMTISAWIKTGTSTEQYISERNNQSYYFATGISSGKLCYYINSVATTWTCSTNSVTDDNWHYVAGTWDGSTKKLYVDGVLDTSTAGTGGNMTSGTTGINIGVRMNSGVPRGHFNGLIDEVKIYNTALTQDEILIDMNAGSAVNFSTGTTEDSSDNPVAEWNFEENTGTTANDTSGNGNTGTITEATWIPGKIGGALKFDGINDIVSAGNDSSLNMDTGDFTMEAWAKISSDTDNYGDLVGKGGWNNSLTYGILATTTSVRGYLSNSGVPDRILTPSYSYTPDTWHHYVVTFDRDSLMSLYVDGKKYSSASINSYSAIDFTNASNLHIGEYPGWYLKGIIDQVKIYDYARTPAQIAYDYNRGAPVGHWKFDEGEGVTAYDSSGNTNNGALGTGTSAPTWTTSGKLNSALTFDGNNDYVSITNNSILQPTTAITVSAWVKETTFNDKWIIHNSTSTYSTNYGYALRTNIGGPEKQFIFIVGNGSTYTDSKTPDTEILSDDTWYHVVGVYDGSTTKIYLNGVLKDTDNAVSSISYSGVSSNVYIGQRADNAFRFDGQIDDVQIYNYALTETQIKNLYNNGAVSFSP